jgi:LacI family transcriptional regulator
MHRHELPTTGLASRVEDSAASGRLAAEALLDESSPTAFVCATDALAMGVVDALDARGLTPGKDVAVVGYGDSAVAELVPGGLTSVRQPLEQAAAALVRGLEGLLGVPAVVAEGAMLTPTLVVRGSS